MKLLGLTDPRFKAAITRLNQEKLPLKVAFKLKGIIKAVDEELAKYEEVRKAALDKYGTKDDNGAFKTDENNNVVLDGEAAQGFVKELNELLALDVALPGLTLSELGDNVNMSSDELFLLDFISE
jgi:hypothetical protein